MRHVRMLGLCLVAVLALSALASSSAMANEKSEKAEFAAFTNCPFHQSSAAGYEIIACNWAESSYKERWLSNAQREKWEEEHGGPPAGLLSHFTAGNISVGLKLPIVLQGGFALNSVIEETEPAEAFEFIAAQGAESIQAVAQPGPSLKKLVNSATLSESEQNRFNYYLHIAKQTKTTATVELAGPASGIHFNLGNLLNGTGTAFRFPVKVKLGNGFFGPDCYVGSNENPVVVEYTSGTAGSLPGKVGEQTFGSGIATVSGDTLVASGFSSPAVENCGVEGSADKAMDEAIGLPSSDNTSVLNGVLKLTASANAEAHGI